MNASYGWMRFIVVLITVTTLRAGIPYEVVKSMGVDEIVGTGPTAPPLEGSDGALYGTTRGSPGGGLPGIDTVFRINKDGTDYRALHSFGSAPNDGYWPDGGLVRGTDGLLYGTTQGGGRLDRGTIYRISENGRNYEIIFHFDGAAGGHVRAGLLSDGAGALYGTTKHGGATANGVIFKVNQDGTDYRVLHHFGVEPFDGEWPETGLTRGSDGVLYGTTSTGGTNSSGTVFRINSDGFGYTTLRHFADAADGAAPFGSVVEGSDGFLYGATLFGGILGGGVIFKLSKDGSQYEVLHRLDRTAGEGDQPWGDLIQGSDGALYGTTRGSTVFKYRLDTRSFHVLRHFNTTDPNPYYVFLAGLLQASDGLLYGASERGGAHSGGILFRIDEQGSNYMKLLDFGAPPNSGGTTPRSSLVCGSDGLLYGTTESGGWSNAGTIFAIDMSGRISRTIKHFGEASDGAHPNGIIEGSDGVLYGTTQTGGTGSDGTLYCIGRNGSNYAVLHNFNVGIFSIDGKMPFGTIVEARDGFLYGTTAFGGESNRGTVFRIGRNGSSYVVIREFMLAADGQAPRDLIEASDGILYGVATAGGISNRGTLFRCSRDGSLFEILHRFAGAADGHHPNGGLIEGTGGYLYGTTTGNTTNYGTIFRLRKDGSDYSVLWRFNTAPAGGQNPKAGLTETEDGDLIGTTWRGGLGSGLGYGTIFRISNDGSRYNVLWRFGSVGSDGRNPVAAVVRGGPEGIYYGTTERGGAMEVGAVFRFDPRIVELTISRQGSSAQVEWPVSSTMDRLEQTISLSSPSWTAVTQPQVNHGSYFQVTVTNATESQRFFRVRRTWR